MARKLTVVVSQGQSANPAKRRLEEDLVAGLLFEQGVEVTVVPHLYDLTPDGTGMLCLTGISGDLVVCSWLFDRAARWVLDRNGIRGREGQVLLKPEADAEDEEDDDAQAAAEADAADERPERPRVADERETPARTIYCLDLKLRPTVEPFLEEIRRLRQEATVQTVSLTGWLGGAAPAAAEARFLRPTNDTSGVDASGRLNGSAPAAPPTSGAAHEQAAAPAAANEPARHEPIRVAEEVARRWYPVIDYSRCTNCLECIDFCLFGVYGIDRADTILVEQPDNCRKGCPACSRVCPENAIIFPQHKTPAIAGSDQAEITGLKIDLSKLFGQPDAVQQAVLERDVELVAAGRDAVGREVGLPKRLVEKPAGPKDDLDRLMDRLDELDL